jgi:hypothetical protein
LSGSQAGAAFGEDAVEEGGGGFVGAAFAAGEFGFGGDEAAFAGGFEDGGAVAFEVGLDALEGCDRCIESRELLINLFNDPHLFYQGCDWHESLTNNSLTYVGLRSAFALFN